MRVHADLPSSGDRSDAGAQGVPQQVQGALLGPCNTPTLVDLRVDLKSTSELSSELMSELSSELTLGSEATVRLLTLLLHVSVTKLLTCSK